MLKVASQTTEKPNTFTPHVCIHDDSIYDDSMLAMVQRVCSAQCSSTRHSCLSYKKLSYRRETARQLPTWRGARPSSPVPPPPMATPMRMVESQTRNKRTSSTPSTKRTLR